MRFPSAKDCPQFTILLLGKKNVFTEVFVRVVYLFKLSNRQRTEASMNRGLRIVVVDVAIYTQRSRWIFNRSGMVAGSRRPNPHSVAISYFLRSDPRLPSASVRRLCRPYDAQDQVSDGFPLADLSLPVV